MPSISLRARLALLVLLALLPVIALLVILRSTLSQDEIEDSDARVRVAAQLVAEAQAAREEGARQMLLGITQAAAQIDPASPACEAFLRDLGSDTASTAAVRDDIALGEVDRLSLTALVLLLAWGGGVLAFVFLVADQQLKRPLEALLVAARRLGSGDLGARAEVGRSSLGLDELALAARSRRTSPTRTAARTSGRCWRRPSAPAGSPAS